MTRQPFVLVDEVWTCAWCAAGLYNSAIMHRDDCRWIADLRGGTS
jgi:hypothetical protein